MRRSCSSINRPAGKPERARGGRRETVPAGVGGDRGEQGARDFGRQRNAQGIGGIGHQGRSPDGLIANNNISFNESFYGAANVAAGAGQANVAAIPGGEGGGDGRGGGAGLVGDARHQCGAAAVDH